MKRSLRLTILDVLARSFFLCNVILDVLARCFGLHYGEGGGMIYFLASYFTFFDICDRHHRKLIICIVHILVGKSLW